MLIKKVVTKPTREEFAETLSKEWNCSVLTGAILFAQFAFETGWGKYCYCWNIGNIRANEDWINKGKDYFQLNDAWEIINNKKVITGGFFRAHDSLSDGIRSHIDFLALNTRYAQAFDVLLETRKVEFSKENAKKYSTQFAIALKRGGYYTGSLQEYSDGISSISSGLVLKDIDPEVVDPEVTLDEITKVKEQPSEWGPITVCEAFERIGLTSVCSVTEE